MTAEEIFEDLLQMAHTRGLSYCAHSTFTNARKIRHDFVLFLKKDMYLRLLL